MKDVLTILSLLVILAVVATATIVTNPGLFNFEGVNAVKNAKAPKGELTLSPETEDLSLLSYNIKWTPDGHISYISFPNGSRRYFISGNQRTYYLDTQGTTTLADAVKNNPKFVETFGPDVNVTYRNGYSTIGSVLQIESSSPNHLVAFSQNEQQAVNPDGTLNYSNFTTSIGLLESNDGGKTWKDFGLVIKGDDYLEPGTKITGVGHPSAIIVGEYIYIYYVDWAAQTKVFHSDQIYLARIKILEGGKRLDKFEFYKEGGFSEGEYNLKPVIPAQDIENGKYSAVPSVSYNTALRKYVAMYETDRGFAIAYSQNGLAFSKNKLIYYFAKPISERQNGDLWNSYPTLLSDKSEQNDGTTGVEGNLYYSTGTWPNTAHQLTKKSFSF